jgi:hypothetical protein
VSLFPPLRFERLFARTLASHLAVLVISGASSSRPDVVDDPLRQCKTHIALPPLGPLASGVMFKARVEAATVGDSNVLTAAD